MDNIHSKRTQIVGMGYVNLATFVWATNAVLGRWLKDAVGPFTLSAARILVASIIYALLLRQQPQEERRIGQDRWLFVLMAITGVVAFSPLFYLGLHYTTAVNCTLINGLTPLITGLFATLLLSQPMSRQQISGAVIALMGVSYLISGGSLSFWATAHVNKGDFIILMSAAVWALYSVISSKAMRNRTTISATAISTLIGLPLLCLLAALELRHTPAKFDVTLIFIILYIGIIPTAVGFYSWNAGVAHLGPSGAVVFYNTLPLYGALLSYLFLGEPVGIPHIVGGALIIGGGIWASRKRAPRAPESIVASGSDQ